MKTNYSISQFAKSYKFILSIFILISLVFTVAGCTTKVSTGKADVETEGFALSIDKNTSAPIDTTSTFSPDSNPIYYVAKINFLPKGTVLKYSWYFGEKRLDKGSLKLDQDVKNRYFNTSLTSKNGGKWSVGDYKVILTGINDGKEILKITSTFNVK